ncbi:hypothetical protein EYF80_013980 [Liparis tanakae]|uniref:Uncharacterized protein n=1 Tax=Liparis tanakae TaxID=230148 RepID=A0A4Z2IFF6_9TELE|nr:hypothetical protein EYF80_013980 [Liparis tanakae]
MTVTYQKRIQFLVGVFGGNGHMTQDLMPDGERERERCYHSSSPSVVTHSASKRLGGDGEVQSAPMRTRSWSHRPVLGSQAGQCGVRIGSCSSDVMETLAHHALTPQPFTGDRRPAACRLRGSPGLLNKI